MRHHASLVALGPWAVPAAAELTRCASPSGRVFGLHVLAEIRAGGQRAALAALANDPAVVIASEDEEQARTTLAELADQFARGFPFSNHAPGAPPKAATEAEEYLNAVVRSEGLDEPEWRLDNRLRDEAKTDSAPTWDAWWQRARPVLETLWDGPPEPAKGH
jgi:hypothetical protein